MRLFVLKLQLLFLATTPVIAQAALQPTIAFEVASVRPSKPDAVQHSSVPLDSGYVFGSAGPDDVRGPSGGSLIATHTPLWRFIVFAYKLTATQEMALRFSIYAGVPKSGAPMWATGSFEGSPEFFDISARAPADTSLGQMRLMMQTLLRERFHLELHEVTADAPVFALTLTKAGETGPKLRVHPADDACAGPPAVTSAVSDLPSVCGVVAKVPSAAPGLHYGGRAVPLALIATTLPTMTGLAALPRPVIDQTRLEALYDFTLTWVHDASGDEAISDNIANFRSALKGQLGLELKSSHAPMKFIVVDHVERPTEN